MSDALRWPPDADALALPIVRATTFAARSAEEHRRRFANGDPQFYQRFIHPTSEAAASALARLEAAEAGLVFSSGMGAIATTLIALLRRGEHVVAHEEIFAQTKTLLRDVLNDYGVDVDFVDARDAGAVRQALTPRTRVIYIETPSNPLLHVIDIAALGEIARSQSLDLVVDGTFASPALQQPLALGATLVVHSGTKYLGGHSDVMCGAIAGTRATIERVRRTQILLGTVLDPHGAWLMHRGLKTLQLRVERQSRSALLIATRLREHHAVRDVRYPFLPGTREHALAVTQMRGGGGVVSFSLKRGTEGARAFVDALRTIPIATSLGSVDTVIELPYDLDFDPMLDQDTTRDRVAGLLRLSIGLEDSEELFADLTQALELVS